MYFNISTVKKDTWVGYSVSIFVISLFFLIFWDLSFLGDGRNPSDTTYFHPVIVLFWVCVVARAVWYLKHDLAEVGKGEPAIRANRDGFWGYPMSVTALIPWIHVDDIFVRTKQDDKTLTIKWRQESLIRFMRDSRQVWSIPESWIKADPDDLAKRLNQLKIESLGLI